MQKKKITLEESTVITCNQCRSKGSISGGARERRRREPLGGSGGKLHQKNFEILRPENTICIGNSMICSDIWHKYHS